MLDTGAWSQLADLRPWLEGRADSTVVVDHHRHGDPDLATMRLIDIHAAAACEPVAGLCVGLLGVDSPAALPVEVATPLYLGLATDTGWFKFPSVTPRTLRLGADLLDAGVDADALYQITEQSDSPARLQLIRRALDSLKLLDGSRVAVMKLRRRDFDETGADPDESGGIIDIPKSVGAVRVVALLTEVDGANAKLSLRSKAHADDEVDVNLVAQRFGGGGHKHAAGARIAEPLDRAAELVASALAP